MIKKIINFIKHKYILIMSLFVKDKGWEESASKSIAEFSSVLRGKTKGKVIEEIIVLSAKLNKTAPVIETSYKKYLRSQSKKKLIKTACILKTFELKNMSKALKKMKRMDHIKEAIDNSKEERKNKNTVNIEPVSVH